MCFALCPRSTVLRRTVLVRTVRTYLYCIIYLTQYYEYGGLRTSVLLSTVLVNIIRFSIPRTPRYAAVIADLIMKYSRHI